MYNKIFLVGMYVVLLVIFMLLYGITGRKVYKKPHKHTHTRHAVNDKTNRQDTNILAPDDKNRIIWIIMEK